MVRVIPTAEQQTPCHSKNFSKNVAVSWTSNRIQTSIGRDLYKYCQVDEFGGWPDGVVPIKTLADSNGGDNTQAEPSVASAPLVDLLNIDHFSIIRLPLFIKMITEGLQKFCLMIVGLCDKYTMNNGKMMFDLNQVIFSIPLKRINVYSNL